LYLGKICTPSGRERDREYVLTTLVPSLYHWRFWSRKRICVSQDGVDESPEGAREMDSVYATWIGLPVVLQVELGDIKVPLRGKLLKDKGETVRIRIDGSDIDIYKTMILAVEEDAMVLLPA
jgi:hypothetical protein